jgi:hypothetical protein
MQPLATHPIYKLTFHVLPPFQINFNFVIIIFVTFECSVCLDA